MSPTQDLAVGAELLGYRVDALVGRGCMGVVYKATHVRLQRTVALKVLAPALAQDPRYRERFLRESQLAASLDHPGVVPVYDAGEADGLLYLVMRYVEGSNLKLLLERNGRLEPARALAIVASVAEALDAAHEGGLIHRDVKPSNVLLEGADDAKRDVFLSDFGLARMVASESALTATDRLVGTPDYVAPEQIKGEPVDGRADQYALACVLYECLAGAPPFRRDSEFATLWAHVEDPVPALSAPHPDLPRSLDAVVAKALAKSPADRHPSCGGFADAVGAALEPGGPVVAAPRRGPARRTVGVVAAAVLIAGALAAVLALTVGGGRESAARPDGEVTPAPPAPAARPDAATAATAEPIPASFTGVVRIDPVTNEVVMGVPQRARDLAVGVGAVWLVDTRGYELILYKVSPARGTVIATLPVSVTDHPRVEVAVGSIWVSGAVTEDIGLEYVYPRIPRLRLSRVDPQTNRLVGEIDTEILCCGELAAGAGSLWSLDRAEQAAIRVDPIGETVTADLAVGGQDVAVGEGRVWILDTIAGSITSVVPRTAEVDRVIPLSGTPTAIAAGEGAVWVSDRAGTLLKVPVSGNAGIDTASVGQGAEDVTIGEGAVWVANTGDGTVSRVDPVTADVVATIPVPGAPTKIAVGEGGVWVIVRGD